MVFSKDCFETFYNPDRLHLYGKTDVKKTGWGIARFADGSVESTMV